MGEDRREREQQQRVPPVREVGRVEEGSLPRVGGVVMLGSEEASACSNETCW